MKTKKILACLMASMMACAAFAGCSDEKEKETDNSSAAEEVENDAAADDAADAPADDNADAPAAEDNAADETDAPIQVETPEFEEAFAAESGDAYLAIVDGQWWIQYWGNIDDEGGMLSYDAGVVPITGDGSYTVSVNADTNGFRFDTTGDANGELVPSGCSFAAVMVKDGTTKYPNMAIEITEIRIDGNAVDLTAKNYTSSDDNVEMRANIYNEWVLDANIPEDAHTADGPLTDTTGYSASIVDPAVFADGWTTVEVDFNVTGTAA